MTAHESAWIACNHPQCETRTPETTDRVQARRWAAHNGWKHVYPSKDYCPVHAGDAPRLEAPTPAPSRLAATLGVPEQPELSDDFSPEARAVRLNRALDKLFDQ